MSKRMHNKIRDWLITLGKDHGYKAWTTDRKSNIEVSKIRNAMVEYRPDVVWKYERTREKVFFELAFEEDYRAVVGEMFLASQVESFSKMYFIRPTEHRSFWKNTEKFLRFAFRREESIVKTHHRPTFIIFDRSLLENSKEDEMKEKIFNRLRKDGWFE